MEVELQDEAHTLIIDFFCEDKDTVKLDECLQIFRDFCIRFNKAVKVQLSTPCFLGSLGSASSSQPGPACGGKVPPGGFTASARSGLPVASGCPSFQGGSALLSPELPCCQV